MTAQLNLPNDLEIRLVAEVNAGRHASLEEAILGTEYRDASKYAASEFGRVPLFVPD